LYAEIKAFFSKGESNFRGFHSIKKENAPLCEPAFCQQPTSLAPVLAQPNFLGSTFLLSQSLKNMFEFFFSNDFLQINFLPSVYPPLQDANKVGENIEKGKND
jgi:hypothetical protein